MARLASAQGAIRATLIAQVLLGGALVGLDVWNARPEATPGMFAPPATGPSVRPYRPDLRPAAPGSPAMNPMPQRLEFGMSGDRITVTGQIAAGDADRFAAWMAEGRAEAAGIDLDSSGGSVNDALAIGRTIRSAGLDTRVGDGAVCMSACPYMLAGGTARQVADGGLVGVHQHYFGENSILPAFLAVQDVQRGQAAVMDYLTEMGVDLRLMSHALKTPPKEINILDPDLMAELNLTTPDDSG